MIDGNLQALGGDQAGIGDDQVDLLASRSPSWHKLMAPGLMVTTGHGTSVTKIVVKVKS